MRKLASFALPFGVGIFLSAYLLPRLVQLAGMVLGTAVCYAFGTAWYWFSAGVPAMAALGACVVPFIPFDLGKMLLAMAVGPLLRRRLEQAGLYRR